MATDNRERELERMFDEGVDMQALEGDDAQYAAALQQIRDGVQAVRDTPAINDAQFDAFMDGIRESIEPRPFRGRSIWAMASLSAAALLVALSLFAVFSMGAEDKLHSPIEAGGTDIPGAHVDWTSDDEFVEVWVSGSGGKDVL